MREKKPKRTRRNSEDMDLAEWIETLAVLIVAGLLILYVLKTGGWSNCFT